MMDTFTISQLIIQIFSFGVVKRELVPGILFMNDLEELVNFIVHEDHHPK
jgi:hypothetical protein